MDEFKLETKRLILRKPQESDWQDIVEGVSELDVAKMTENIPHPYFKKDAEWFIKDALEKWEKKTAIQFFIELKEEKKVIGVMALTNINEFNGTSTTGSWINKKYWRNGYITEAKIAINDFAFNELKLRRLNSTVKDDNQASNATQNKMGYKLEGFQRQGSRSKATGEIHNVNMYGLLKEDWEAVRANLISNNVH